MTEHEAFPRAPSAPLPWRVRACRLLWRVLLYVWSVLIAGVIIGTIANLNTTTTDTPLAKLFIVHLAQTYPLPVWSSLGLLAVLTLLAWLGSREKQTLPARPLSEQDRSHRQKQIALDKVEKLVPGVDVSLYQDTFGKPTFINHKSFGSLSMVV